MNLQKSYVCFCSRFRWPEQSDLPHAMRNNPTPWRYLPRIGAWKCTVLSLLSLPNSAANHLVHRNWIYFSLKTLHFSHWTRQAALFSTPIYTLFLVFLGNPGSWFRVRINHIIRIMEKALHIFNRHGIFAAIGQMIYCIVLY